MKRAFSVLLLVSLLFSCSSNVERCTINGRYSTAPDGTVLYVTPVDDILSPLDSATVKNGKFTFTLPGAARQVCFISSQSVLDGNYLVVEPGVLDVDFLADVFVRGTASNERLGRFLAEKEKIVNLRRMCSPEVVKMLGVDEAMCDSLKELAVMAGSVFEAYALKEIRENIDAPLGCFYLTQSAGVVSPARLLPLFDRVPVEYRDKLYNVIRKRVETEIGNVAVTGKYIDEVSENLVATGVGRRFQNFELNDINGGKLLLSDEVFANRYTLLFFWGSWQSGAEEQMGVLSAVYDRYRSKGLQMVGISLDESVAACKAFTDRLQISWPQLCNPDGGSAEVSAAYGVTELPAAVLINKRGTVIARMSTIADVLKKFEELF